MLVGTGWSYMKPLLAQREKRILMVVIPLQVRPPAHPCSILLLARVAMQGKQCNFIILLDLSLAG